MRLNTLRPEGPEGRDIRTDTERTGDAFAEIIDLAFRSDGLPEEAGEPMHVSVLMPLKGLQTGRGWGQMGKRPAGMKQLLRAACCAKIIPAVLGEAGEVLAIGRKSRTTD